MKISNIFIYSLFGIGGIIIIWYFFFKKEDETTKNGDKSGGGTPLPPTRAAAIIDSTDWYNGEDVYITSWNVFKGIKLYPYIDSTQVLDFSNPITRKGDFSLFEYKKKIGTATGKKWINPIDGKVYIGIRIAEYEIPQAPNSIFYTLCSEVASEANNSFCQ